MTIIISRRNLVAQSDGSFKSRLWNGNWFSMQADGTFGERVPPDGDGPWEKGYVQDNLLVFYDSAYPTGCWAARLVD